MTDAEQDDAPAASFSAAMEELRTLVAQLEADELDIDELSDRVARAVELVEWCRDRIDATRFEVDQVLVGLDTGEDTPVADDD